MKKILHLITSLEGGGTENFLYQILAHTPAGYDHQVLYLKKDGVIGERMRRRRIAVRPAGSLPSLYQTLRQEKPQILHTCLYSAHLAGRWLGRIAKIPAVITSQRAIDIWQKPWQRWLDTRTLPLSAAVMVNSRAAARLIEARRGGPAGPEIFEIPNGVDTAVFKAFDRGAARERYGLPKDAVVGGTLMRLHEEKGADFIPQFAGRLLPAFPRLHLLIGGVGPLAQGLQEQIGAAEYNGRVHWVGWDNEAPVFLSACDFFWSLSREESFPQTLVEASAMGLPWIAPDVGGVSDLRQTGAAGLLFQRLNLREAAEKAADLLQQLGPLTERARQAVAPVCAQYALAKMVERVYGVFERFSGRV